LEGREEKEGETRRLGEINRIAAAYYHELLLKSAEAERARNYLLGRGLSEQVIRDFQLGFSLDSWEALRQYLVGFGCQEEELVNVGLVIKKELAGSYDRFRNRLMFPIRDVKGEILGFGARTLDDSLPKYLNSPQTTLFDKGEVLYGIDRAKEAIRRENLAIVVEGYMDVIAAHQHGFEDVVASMGTSLTERQVGILKKLTKNLILALDADSAGEMATLRGVEVAANVFDRRTVPVFTSQGRVKYENTLDAEVKVLVLPQGEDPDELIRKNPKGWQSRVEEALPIVDYAFKMVTSKLNLNNLKDKSAAVNQLLPFVEEIEHPIRRAHYTQKLAHLVGVDQQWLVDALARARASRLKGKEKTSSSLSIPSLSTGDSLVEEYCLSLLFCHPELHYHAGELSAEYFEHSENRELFLAWCNNPCLNLLQGELDTILGEHLNTLRQKAFPPLKEEELERVLSDCSRCLQERWLRDMKAKEALLISEAQSPEEAKELQQLGVELNSQLREVFRQRKKLER
jgi:DNA primase